MPNYTLFEAIFENQEEFDKKELVVPIQVDLNDVEQWFPDIDDDFNMNMENTTVVFRSGHTRCLKVSFNDFTLEMNLHYPLKFYSRD